MTWRRIARLARGVTYRLATVSIRLRLAMRCDNDQLAFQIARQLNLVGMNGSHNDVSGGRAIEIFANENVDELIEFNSGRNCYKDCNFSFTGLEGGVHAYLQRCRASGS